MKKSRKIFAPLLAFGLVALLAAVMLITYYHFKPKPVEGSKEVMVEVVIPDEETKEFTLNTDAEYLSQALDEKDLIKGDKSASGLYITEVNGRTADNSKREWWCISKNGEDALTGADQIVIEDGDHYEITLKNY